MVSYEKRGKHTYRLREVIGYNEEGNPIRKSKTIVATRKKDLDKEILLFRLELEERGLIKEHNYTFSRFMNEIWEPEYASKPENLAMNTYQLYKRLLNERVIPVIGKMMIDKVTTLDLQRILDNTQRSDGKEGPVSRSTKRNLMYAIRSVFALAEKWNFIAREPSKELSVGRDMRTDKKTYKPYSTKEISFIFECLQSEPLDLQVMLTIALITGARVGEIAAIEEKHIDFENQSITLEQTIIQPPKQKPRLQTYTKTDEGKVVSVTDELLQLLRIYISGRKEFWKIQSIEGTRKYLFCHLNGNPFRPQSLYQRFLRFQQRYGIRKVRFHDLRHTSATYLLSEGTPMKVIQERLGHKDISTTMNIYAHVLKEVDQKSADLFKKVSFKNVPAPSLPQIEELDKKRTSSH